MGCGRCPYVLIGSDLVWVVCVVFMFLIGSDLVWAMCGVFMFLIGGDLVWAVGAVFMYCSVVNSCGLCALSLCF